MVTWKEWVWHLVRLALAAALLAWDTRVFLFYAFTMVLTVLRQVDYVRATVRVFQTVNDHRFILLMRQAGITQADLDVHAVIVEADEEGNESLKRDLKLVAPNGVPAKSYLA